MVLHCSPRPPLLPTQTSPSVLCLLCCRSVDARGSSIRSIRCGRSIRWGSLLLFLQSKRPGRWAGSFLLPFPFPEARRPALRRVLGRSVLVPPGRGLGGAGLHGDDLHGDDLHGDDLHGGGLHGGGLHGAGLRQRGDVLAALLLLQDADAGVEVVPLLLQRAAQPLQELQLPLQGLEVAVTQGFLSERTGRTKTLRFDILGSSSTEAGAA